MSDLRDFYEEARRRAAGDVEMLARIDRDERTEFRVLTEAPEPPPCPSWCELPEGHVYDNVLSATVEDEVMTFTRSHQLGDGIGHDTVYAFEENRGGVVVNFEGPYVLVGPNLDRVFAAGELRKEAAELLNAADRLDEITGATS